MLAAGRAALKFWTLLGATASLLACTADAPPETAELSFEYAGCQTVLKLRETELVCAVGEDERTLTLWTDVPPDAVLSVATGGPPETVVGEPVLGGRRFSVAIPTPAPSALRVSARRGREVRAATLSLTEAARPAWLRDAVKTVRRGELDTAEQLLQAHAGGASLALGSKIQSLLARIALRRGERAHSLHLLREAVAGHRAAGNLLQEFDDATVLAFLLVQERDFTAARSVLVPLELPLHAPAEARFWTAYYQGYLAYSTSDLRAALADFAAAVAQAARVGLVRDHWMASQTLGLVLQKLGRSQEAAQVFAQLREQPHHGSPCEWAQLLDNQAWSLLLAQEAGQPGGDPVPVLADAEEIYASEACLNLAQLRVNLQINLALARLQHGEVKAARQALQRAHGEGAPPSLLQRLWWLDLEARIALAEQQPRAALALYRREEELAHSASLADSRWRATVGRAHAHLLLGEAAAALGALSRAEALLDEETLLVPIHEGIETFVAQREAGTRLLLELLLAAGRKRDALEVARHARSRVLRRLQRSDRLAQLEPAERQIWDLAVAAYAAERAQLDRDAAADWQLPSDQLRRVLEQRTLRYQALQQALDRAFAVLGAAKPALRLPALRPGEVLLTYHPLPTGWVGFAADDLGVNAQRLTLPGLDHDDWRSVRPEALTQHLLTPFAPQIASAQRIRVLPYGTLREVDFHALPWQGSVLLAAKPVVYGLDLDPSTAPEPRRGQALLVIDPQGDLPAARAEGQAVRALLVGFDLEMLVGEQAEAAAVKARLPAVDLLHYAGHGVFAGRGGWGSFLPLAQQGRLTLGDLLVLPHVPRWVVLSSCDTGRSAAATIESLGLTHAFLLAGSRQVLAATRPVDDRAVALQVSELYRQWPTTDEADAAALLRTVQLAWRRLTPAADWASFRAFEP